VEALFGDRRGFGRASRGELVVCFRLGGFNADFESCRHVGGVELTVDGSYLSSGLRKGF
jgi:hypothetical protein